MRRPNAARTIGIGAAISGAGNRIFDRHQGEWVPMPAMFAAMPPMRRGNTPIATPDERPTYDLHTTYHTVWYWFGGAHHAPPDHLDRKIADL